jgi:argininosuccinate lyase
MRKKVAFKEETVPSSMKVAYEWELRPEEYLMETLDFADIAHVAMLIRKGIIEREKGKRILNGLLEFQRIRAWNGRISPHRGDVYTNRRYHLKRYIGDLANYIEAGRSRREATNIAFLIVSREMIVDLGLSLCDLCKEILRLANKYKKTYMTDFTYLQHAHPTTLGHYLLSYLYPLIRDTKRLMNRYNQINQSPAGSGSVNGSILPLDRKFLCDLLGFDSLITHTRDAMWRHDTVIEAFLPVMTVLTTLGRFCDDLIVWNTTEFGFVEFSDMHIRKSVIMPQKKNPYALTFIRGLARYTIGRFISIITTGHTPSGQPDNRIFVYHDFPDSLVVTKRVVELFADVIKKAEFNRKRLQESCAQHFTIATDIVDYMVANYGFDNRTAYAIVQKAVNKALAMRQSYLNADLLYDAARSLSITLPGSLADVFKEGLQVQELIQKRRGIGAANVDSIDGMITECKEMIKESYRFFSLRTPDRFRRRFHKRIEGFLRTL